MLEYAIGILPTKQCEHFTRSDNAAGFFCRGSEAVGFNHRLLYV